MVETQAQYEFIYQIVRRYVKDKRRWDESYNKWKSGLGEKFHLNYCYDSLYTCFRAIKEPKLLKEFTDSSCKVIEEELPRFDVVVGVAPKGYIQAPLIAQKTGK